MLGINRNSWKWFEFAGAFLLLLGLCACGGAPMVADEPGYAGGPPPAPMVEQAPVVTATMDAGEMAASASRATAAMASMGAPARKAAPSPPSSSAAKEPTKLATKQRPVRPQAEQLLIFTGNLQMRVLEAEFATTLDRLVDVAVGAGGYIAAQNNRSVTVRVPSADFRDAMRKMEKLGEVTDRQVQAQDVTEEHHDVKVRLQSLRATRKRLEAFLERAKTIQEVLRVEQELTRLNGEIDKLEGRKRYLAARAAFSTITIALTPKPKNVVVVERKKRPTRPQTISLPIEWLNSVGLDQLLQLR
jgi:hypothetical protein